MNSKNIYFPLIIIVVLFLGAWTYTRAVGNQITVCIKKTGLIYVIGQDFTRYDCKKTDQLLSWNSAGVQGPKGDKGDKGDIGEQGPVGLTGPKGDSGVSSSLHLYDANNQDLGIVLQASPGIFTTYLSDLAVLVTFHQGKNQVTFNPTNPNKIQIYFREKDCTGQSFTTGIKPMELFEAIGGGFVVWLEYVNPSVAELSKSKITSSGCQNVTENPDPSEQVLVKFVDVPFNLPINSPLKLINSI